MKNRQSIREATAGLHVVIPKYLGNKPYSENSNFIAKLDTNLGFKVNGGNNWVLQSGESYEISTEIFESAGRSLFLANVIEMCCK